MYFFILSLGPLAADRSTWMLSFWLKKRALIDPYWRLKVLSIYLFIQQLFIGYLLWDRHYTRWGWTRKWSLLWGMTVIYLFTCLSSHLVLGRCGRWTLRLIKLTNLFPSFMLSLIFYIFLNIAWKGNSCISNQICPASYTLIAEMPCSEVFFLLVYILRAPPRGTLLYVATFHARR